jgi:hypothetical protein
MMWAMSVIIPASFSAVDIVDRYQLGKGVCGDVIELHPLDVNEAASSTAVNEGLCASLDCSVH